MSTQQFHLLGRPVSTARDIQLPDSSDFEDLQQEIAAHYSIVDAKGVGFLHHQHRLTALADIASKHGPVAITIDGKAIYPDHLGNHQRLYERFGPLFSTSNMGSHIYHTNDPKLSTIFFTESEFFTKKITPGHPLHPIKSIEAGVFLGDTDTEEWRLAHKFLPPALGLKAVRHYAPSMQKNVEQAFKVFDELDERGESWNVYQYMLKLGSQAVGKLILGIDFNHFTGVDAPLHEMVMQIARILELNKRISSIGSWYASMPFGDAKELRHRNARIEEMLHQSIAQASRGREDLDLQDAALTADNVIDYLLRAKDSKGNKLPPVQLAPALVVTTAAGFTTTSSLLSWLIYSLVQYDGTQKRLLQELIDNDWDEDTQVTAALTNKLAYLDKFIKEAQRRHNPAYHPSRMARRDVILPGGYMMPKDSVVTMDLHHLHHNDKIWENPNRFDVDRWDTEKVKTRPQGSYTPFAQGQRACIGFNFALQEIKVFLPKLVYRYKFSLAQDGPIEYDAYFQLIRPVNLYVRAEKRVKWPPKTE